jgi:hypothetical protein
MKTFKFKRDFEDRLEGVRDLYFENLRKQGRYTYYRLIQLNSIIKFEDMLADSFLWKKTPQGHEFWKKISKR